MGYITAVLSFLLAIVALCGETWNKKASGAKRLTVTGWIVLSLLFLALVASIYQTRQQQLAMETRQAENAQLATIIRKQVASSIEDLLYPFRELYMDNIGGRYIPERQLTIGKLSSASAIDAAKRTCLRMKPKNIVSYPDEGTWENIFRGSLMSGTTGLRNLVAVYSNDISPAMLNAITDLENDSLIQGYTRPAPQEDDSGGPLANIRPCAIGWPIEAAWPIGAYKKYLALVSKVNELNRSGDIVR